MTTDAVVELLRHALLAAFWIAAPLMAIAFAAGVVISLAQIDLHSGYRLQHYSPPDRVCAGHPAADALDDPTHNGLHHGFVGRSGAVCPLISPWASPCSTGFCWCWHGFPESSRWCPCPAFKAPLGWHAWSCRY